MTTEKLVANINYACGSGLADCKAIQEDGPCYSTDVIKMASYAMNAYYYGAGHREINCYFDGSALIVQRDPSLAATISATRSWCVSKPGMTTEKLVANINYACGSGLADCKAIQEDGPCYSTDVIKMASYAMNAYYYGAGHREINCYFDGSALIVHHDPSLAATISTTRSWCVSKPGMTTEKLVANINYACGSGLADCKAIQEDGPCYSTDVIKMASYAMNAYYYGAGHREINCYFDGSALIVHHDPSLAATISATRSWCVSKPGMTTEKLVANINYACGSGLADCKSIQEDGPCYSTDVIKMASYAMNAYYYGAGHREINCYFDGSALIVHHDPSYDDCIYP
ncbi:hypothetical protein ZIOFF_050125 [Zingiber officinale]|uniref:X8 domain-containing protein n=1 Tax=Zingiber officinale TaxID=94328 RepID=A0A8J5FPG7_ZINOF|nr:hypothetical protein ZIOFF_050125 [Zingiber officinale]